MRVTRARVRSICAAVAIVAVLGGCGSEGASAAGPSTTRTTTAAAPKLRALGENWDTVLGLTSPTAKDIEFLIAINADDPRWRGETGFDLSYRARNNCKYTVDWLVDNHAGVNAIIARAADRRIYFNAAQQVYC